MEKTKQISLIFFILLVSLALMAMGTIEEDEKDCADQLTNLAACIPYVSGTAKKPTQECCDDTKKVKSAKPKCLCVLIKESTDPSLGLPINTTLALQMPSSCNIDAKISDCPSLLNLAPDSADAKIFKVATADSSSTSGSPPASASASTSSATPSSSSSTSSDTKATTSSTSNNGPILGQNFLVIIGFAVVVLLFL